MKSKDIVDLSQVLMKGEEHNFTFDADIRDATEYMPELQHDDDVWYIISQLNMCSHNGTHLEVPFHHLKDGEDLTDHALTKLVGNLVIIDITHKPIHEAYTLEEMKKHDSEIKEGDIVVLKTGQDVLFRSEKWCEYPYIDVEILTWLADKKIKCLGTDAAGIEHIYERNQPAHTTLFKRNISLIESLTNLDKVESNKYILFVLPLPMKGLGASPLRAVAIRKEALVELASK